MDVPQPKKTNSCVTFFGNATLVLAQLLQAGDGVGILGVKGQGFFVVLDGAGLVAGVHVSFAQAVAVSEGSKPRQGELDGISAGFERTRAKRLRLFISDKCLGLVEGLGEFYPEAMWQRCTVHFYRNVWTAVPTSKAKEVAAMLKTIHAHEERAAGRTSSSEAQRDETGRRSGAAKRGDRRDVVLLRVSERVLAVPEVE
jgi:hypothetical protein